MSIKKQWLLVLLLAVIIFNVPFNRIQAAETSEVKELKVLVIEIDPYLKSKEMKTTDFLIK